MIARLSLCFSGWGLRRKGISLGQLHQMSAWNMVGKVAAEMVKIRAVNFLQVQASSLGESEAPDYEEPVVKAERHRPSLQPDQGFAIVTARLCPLAAVA